MFCTENVFVFDARKVLQTLKEEVAGTTKLQNPIVILGKTDTSSTQTHAAEALDYVCKTEDCDDNDDSEDSDRYLHTYSLTSVVKGWLPIFLDRKRFFNLKSEKIETDR